MIRSSLNLFSTPIGVNASGVLTMHLNLPEAKYPRSDDEIAFHGRLKNRLAALPGAERISIASQLPASGWMPLRYEVEGLPPADKQRLPLVGGLAVGADYFDVMQVRARRGRLFNASNGAGDVQAVIVNDSFRKHRYGPGKIRSQNASVWRGRTRRKLGSTWWAWCPTFNRISSRPLEQDALIYLPYSTMPQRIMYVVARTAVPPSSLAAAFRREVQRLDENLAVYDVRTLDEHLAERRLNVTSFGVLFTIFAIVALVLAWIGLYGVVAHSVSRRTREIGVRMAVGGTRRDIVRLVFAQGMRQVALGLAIGLPMAFAVTRVLRAALVGVAPGDPVTFAGVVLVLLGAGALGCAIPARRAIRVDPLTALRCD